MHAAIAHLLRRTGFGPHPGQVDELAALGLEATTDLVLAAPPQSPGPPPSFKDDDDPPRRWLSLMADPAAGLHEKMVWFWHGHLTSSDDKVGDYRLLYRQHLLLRQHALGNFRELLQAIAVDAAMLTFLDGDGSTADAPNENFGREVMELFALGRGHYGQGDVRAAAVAFSGWSVDEKGVASFDPSSGPPGPVTLLGRQVSSAANAVDVICDQPACAAWIAARLYAFLAGRPPTAPVAARLASGFRSRGLDVRWLVEAIVRDPSFWEVHLNRPRYPVEWVIAAAAALGTTHDAGALLDACTQLGQVPYNPPNVAGWPAGPRWVSASRAVARLALALTPGATVRDADAALHRCSLYEVSDKTAAAIRQADPALALALAVSSPEFALA